MFHTATASPFTTVSSVAGFDGSNGGTKRNKKAVLSQGTREMPCVIYLTAIPP